MWIIAGLGNPGTRYVKTRHNIGFRVIDRLAEAYNIKLKDKDAYSSGNGVLEGHRVVLLKPLTFMNRSGIAVLDIFKRHNALPENLIVVHDDLDLDTGLVKLRRNGSSGGHKGIESIINSLGSKDFVRIKVGIGRDANIAVEDYVLSSFRPFEKKAIEDAIIKASDVVAAVITEGINPAMNKYNRQLKA